MPVPTPASACPVARSVDLLGDRWSLLILRDAFDGISRFGEFQRSLGVARNILADRLQRLVAADLLQTQPVAEGSAYQGYALTPKGEALFPILVALRQWGEQHLFARGERHSTLIERQTGRPIAFMAPRAADDSVLRPDRTTVKKVT